MLIENFHFCSFLTIFWLFLAIFEILNFENENFFDPVLENFNTVILSHRRALYL